MGDENIEISNADGISRMKIDEKGDVADADGFFGKFSLSSRKSKDKVEKGIQLHGSFDSYEYCMNFPKRGKCLIFNHKTFHPKTNLNIRNGTDADAAGLYCRFRELDFDVETCSNFTVKEVYDKLKTVADADHSDYSCFVCCILSHGDLGILYAKDGKYPVDDVFAPFRGDVCPSLVGKPKMFFIQACQGDQLDAGVKVTYKEYADSSNEFKIPTHADFLIVYSTVPGFYSWRNTTAGSWFIQALCDALREHGKTKDLLSIMTVVNRRVTFFESNTPQDSVMDNKKQVPLVTSTLIRDVFFK